MKNARYTWGGVLTAAVMIAVLLSGCTRAKYHIEGVITDAEDSVLYIDNLALGGPEVVDSVVLDESGAFCFSGDAVSAPEFFRLRIAKRIINVCIDSTETVTVRASYPTMTRDYEVSGSYSCEKIRELVMKQLDLQAAIAAVARDYDMPGQTARDSIQTLIEAYRTDVRMNYIYKEPMCAYAYFALFQAIGGQLIFNPRENRDDIKAFAAVATSWDTYHPGSLRGENLHNIAIESMKNMRIADNNRAAQIDVSKISVTNIIDITLTDNRGIQRSLTDLEGKVVLLDFHAFAIDGSRERIMLLRELYNKYHAQGLEIYQVSVDTDEHFWKQQTEALPWISVRDAAGINSENIARYNVQAIPTFFLIDRTNSIYKRDSEISDIDAEIKGLIK